jgi:hypothetical protein
VSEFVGGFHGLKFAGFGCYEDGKERWGLAVSGEWDGSEAPVLISSDGVSQQGIFAKFAVVLNDGFSGRGGTPFQEEERALHGRSSGASGEWDDGTAGALAVHSPGLSIRDPVL